MSTRARVATRLSSPCTSCRWSWCGSPCGSALLVRTSLRNLQCSCSILQCQKQQQTKLPIKVIWPEVLVSFYSTILDLRIREWTDLRLFWWSTHALKSVHQILLQELEEYKRCLSHATKMTTTIHQHGDVCEVVTKSWTMKSSVTQNLSSHPSFRIMCSA